ncbi:hypothetical protein ACOMHN_047444 [Nucella lapillus]
MSAAGEKDPYMQAYITARMKNQVEEMKLQKMLSTMEVSQKVNKIMINLELFEDRKTAHKLQQEVEEMKLQKMLSTMEVSQKVNKIMINLELFEDRKTAHKLQQELMVAVISDQLMVAVISDQLMLAVISDQLMLAVISDQLMLAVISDQLMLAVISDQLMLAVISDQLMLAVISDELMLAVISDQLMLAVISDQLMLAVISDQLMLAVISDQLMLAVISDQLMLAVISDQLMLAVISDQLMLAVISDQLMLAVISDQLMLAVISDQLMLAVISDQLMLAVVKVSRRQRKVTNSFLQQKADLHQRTANWTSSMMTSSSEYTHNLANALGSHQPAGERAIYPVTKVKDFNTPSAWGTRDILPDINPNSRGPSGRVPSRQHKHPVTLPEPHSTTPMIQITDCNGDGVTVVGPEPVKSAEGRDTSTKAVPKWAYDSTAKAGASWIVPPPTKTTVIITPPPLTGSHRGSHPTQRRPATEPYRRSAEGSVCFPPVVRARSTRTRYTRSTHTASTHKRLANASRMWPGDPRAICSVRRDRKNVDEMLATKKAGEETRRLIRESVAPCSRNCNKPNIISLMERTYVNLPDLLPEIEKARKRMYGDVGETTPRQDKRSSAEKKRQVGRFELEAEQVEGSKELPIYKIDYNKLREMGGTRRNSVLA